MLFWRGIFLFQMSVLEREFKSWFFYSLGIFLGICFLHLHEEHLIIWVRWSLCKYLLHLILICMIFCVLSNKHFIYTCLYYSFAFLHLNLITVVSFNWIGAWEMCVQISWCLYNFLQKTCCICYVVLREQSYTGIWASESFIRYVSFITFIINKQRSTPFF